jgi:HEAT repeat protein
MKRVGVLVAVILVVAATGAVSQNQSSQNGQQNGEEERLQTIEELYLSQDVELQILRSQALSNERETKLLALQSIRSMLQDGGIANRQEMLLILESLATEGTRREVRSGGAVVNNYPEIRRQAVNVMGDMEGEEVKDSLVTVLQVEQEPMVLAEAVYALGRIEDDTDSRTLDYIGRVLSRENVKRAPDNNLAFASLLAVEKIANRTDGINNPELLDALLGVTSGSYIRDVRLKAIDVIYKLRGGGGSSASAN